MPMDRDEGNKCGQHTLQAGWVAQMPFISDLVALPVCTRYVAISRSLGLAYVHAESLPLVVLFQFVRSQPAARRTIQQ